MQLFLVFGQNDEFVPQARAQGTSKAERELSRPQSSRVYAEDRRLAEIHVHRHIAFVDILAIFVYTRIRDKTSRKFMFTSAYLRVA